MNEILSIANKPETQNLCDRCLGRLFGKLGYNLNNPTRGKAIRLLLHLNDMLNSKLSGIKPTLDQLNILNKLPQNYNEIQHMLEDFNLNKEQMSIISNIFNNLKNKSSVTPNASEDQSPIQKELQKQMRSIIDEKFSKNLAKRNNSCNLCNGIFDELVKFTELTASAVKNYELHITSY